VLVVIITLYNVFLNAVVLMGFGVEESVHVMESVYVMTTFAPLGCMISLNNNILELNK